MLRLYNIALLILLVALAPVLALIVLLVEKFRKNIWGRLGLFASESEAWLASLGDRPVLVHSVSVGEVGAAMRIVEKLKELNLPIVLTTTTVTGQAVAKKELGSSGVVLYFPLDIPFIVRRFLRRVNPRCAIILETELWPNFIHECQKASIPLALVNGRLSDRSFSRFRLIRPFVARLLSAFSAILVQTELDAERLAALGAPASLLKVCGNVKFDIAQKRLSEGQRCRLAREFGFEPGRPIIVAGSTHQGEEEALLAAFVNLRRTRPELGMIIAPRNVNRRDEIARLARRMSIRFATRSSMDRTQHPADLLILDTIGELKSAYHIATVAFVGKSLPTAKAAGGHNPLEPAAAGVPAIFGPNMQNFRQAASALLSAGAAAQVKSNEELVDVLQSILSSKAKRRQMATAALQVMAANRGATDKIVAHLQSIGLLDNRREQKSPARWPPRLRAPSRLILSQIDPGWHTEAENTSRLARGLVRAGLAALEPACILYWAGVTARAGLYASGWLKSYYPGRPTLCVGNLTVGGSGKTPAVALICQLLLQKGLKPAILSRGFGRGSSGLIAIAPGEKPWAGPKDGVSRVGDEIVMLRDILAHVPIVVGADRAAAARLCVERFGPDVLVMDDGFGHLRLRRDLDILTLDATNPFGNGKLLPCGTLREPISALSRAEVAILTRTDQATRTQLEATRNRLKLINPNLTVINSVHRPTCLRRLSDMRRFDLDFLLGKRVLAVCGIAKPESFFLTLSRLGASVTRVAFPDHHLFSRRETAALFARLKTEGHELIVTTEKDAVRLSDQLPEEAQSTFALQIELSPCTPEETEALSEVILAHISG